VYSLVLTPEELTALIERPDPDRVTTGNRKIRVDHAQAFARYVIDNPLWVAPGVILRAPQMFKFVQDEEVPNLDFGRLSYQARDARDIQILDGQHRILGFHLALDMIRQNLEKARGARAASKRVDPGGAAEAEQSRVIEELEKARKRLAEERLSVEIQVTEDALEYRQMFFDIAENALGISASVKARFDSSKVVNRALEQILELPLLKNRIELEVDRLPKRSPHILSARHVAETTRVLVVGYDGRVSRRQESELKETEITAIASEFFGRMSRMFPELAAVERGELTAESLRLQSMLGSPLFVRIIAGVEYELRRKRSWPASDVDEFFGRLATHVTAPATTDSIWKIHADPEAFAVDAWSPSGRRQDAKGLVDTIAEWASSRADFV
jgi:hypothetical protein